VQEIPNESWQARSMRYSAAGPENFHIIAKNEKEIHVAGEMNDSGMKKK
jgi:hypothetical protein